MILLEKMGVMGYPLLLCSSIALAIIIERFIYFLRLQPISGDIIQKIILDVSLDETDHSSLSKNRFGKILEDLLKKLDFKRAEKDSYFNLQLMNMNQEMNRYLPILKMLATIAPLLGLLGTILGIIEAFDTIAQVKGPVTPSLVAKGISHALFTTASGLVIAIPALLANSLFHLRITSLNRKITQQLNLVDLHFDRKKTKVA